jgi:hypothetical protein
MAAKKTPKTPPQPKKAKQARPAKTAKAAIPPVESAMPEASQPEATLATPVIADETPEVSTGATPATFEADRELQTKVADERMTETTALPDRVGDNLTVEAGRVAPGPKERPKRAKKEAKAPGKLSALDAAALVLAEAGQPMTCQELIGAMAARGYWSSPAGKTPASTLYSAMLREAATKGDQARFVKTDRGRFALRTLPAPA